MLASMIVSFTNAAIPYHHPCIWPWDPRFPIAVQETERRSIPVWEKALKWILGTKQVSLFNPPTIMAAFLLGAWKSLDSSHTLFTKFESSWVTKPGVNQRSSFFSKTFNVSWSSSFATQQIKRTRSYIQILVFEGNFAEAFAIASFKSQRSYQNVQPHCRGHLYKSTRSSFSV